MSIQMYFDSNFTLDLFKYNTLQVSVYHKVLHTFYMQHQVNQMKLQLNFKEIKTNQFVVMNVTLKQIKEQKYMCALLRCH